MAHSPLTRPWCSSPVVAEFDDRRSNVVIAIVLYYVSESDGFRCIQARRLDSATKRPVGPAIDVYHSHNARRSLMNPWLGHLEISVSADKLFFNLGETTGNIWMAEWKP